MPTKEINIGRPNPKQAKMFLSRKRYIFFGGARGGGKSWAVRAKAIMLCLRYPGIRVGIARKTYPELMANHISILREKLWGIAKYNDKDKVFRFPNGSTITFRYCAADRDLDGWMGIELDVLFLDEAGNFPELHIKKMIACVRGANGYPKRVYFTGNPGGVSHQFLRRLFVSKKYETGENPDDYEFIQSLVSDNFALMEADPDYAKQLEMLPPKLRRAWLEGEWDTFDGIYFEEFRDDPEGYDTRQWTHVINPFDIPDYWPVYRSYDYGYAKPFSCNYWAVDQNDVVYNIAEMYGVTDTPNEGVKWDALRQATEIKAYEEGHPLLKGKHITGVADPAIFAADGGESIADTMRKAGIYFYAADNQRINGWMQVHYRLAFSPDGYPRMYFFNTCKHMIRTIPLQMYDTVKAEDLDTSLEDHAVDSMRYFCMSRPVKPMIKEIAVPRGDDPLNQRQIQKQPTNIYKYNL